VPEGEEMSGRGEFVHEEIEVEFSQRPGPPISIEWKGKKIAVAEVLRAWPDHGFGPFRHAARWWQRRHRNYYRVKTAEGEILEFYLDRGSRKWVLSRRWGKETGGDAP
jgi:hypothetical protein